MAFELPEEAVANLAIPQNQPADAGGFSLPEEAQKKAVPDLVNDEDFDPISYAMETGDDATAKEVHFQKNQRPMTLKRFGKAVKNFGSSAVDLVADWGGGLGNIAVNTPEALSSPDAPIWKKQGIDPDTARVLIERAKTQQLLAAQNIEENNKTFLGKIYDKVIQPVVRKLDRASAGAVGNEETIDMDSYNAVKAQEDEHLKSREYSDQKFDEALAHAKKIRSIQQGNIQQDGVVAGGLKGLDYAVQRLAGAQPEDIHPELHFESGEELAAQGAPVDPDAIRQMGTSADPINLAPLHVPGQGLILNKVAGAGLRVAAAPLRATAAAIEKVPMLAKKTGVSALGKYGLVGVTAAHPIMAAKSLAAYVGPKVLGHVIDNAGKKLINPQFVSAAEKAAAEEAMKAGGRKFFSGKQIAADAERTANKVIGGAASAAVSMAPLNAAISDTPEEFGSMEGGVAGFGGLAGATGYHPTKGFNPEHVQAVDSVLREQGAAKKYGTPLDAAHDAFMQNVPQWVRDGVNAYKGFFNGFKFANGKEPEIYVLPRDQFAEEVVKAEAAAGRTTTPEEAARQRGHKSGDGKVLINGDFGQGSGTEASLTLGHEAGGHVAQTIMQLLAPDIEASMTKTAQRNLLTKNGRPTAKLQKFIDGYNKAFDPTGKTQRLDPTDPEAINEWLAEEGRRAMEGGGPAKFAAGQSLRETLLDNIGDYFRKTFGTKYKFDRSEVPKVAREFRNLLFELGRLRGQHPDHEVSGAAAGDPAAPAPTGSPDPAAAPAGGPVPVAPVAPMANERGAVMAAMERLGYPSKIAQQMAAAAQGATVEEMIKDALAKKQVTPATPPTPQTPVSAPVAPVEAKNGATGQPEAALEGFETPVAVAEPGKDDLSEFNEQATPPTDVPAGAEPVPSEPSPNSVPTPGKDPVPSVPQEVLEGLGYGPEHIANIQQLQNNLGKGVVLRDYNAAEQEGHETGAGLDLSAEKRGKEYQASATGDIGKRKGAITKQDKSFTPYSVTVTSKGVIIRGFDHDKFLGNFADILDAMPEDDKKAVTATKKGETLDQKVADGFRKVAENHANGWKGDGSAPLKVFPDSGITQNLDYVGKPVDKALAEAINMAMNIKPKGKVSEGLATMNEGFLNRETGETNALRDRMEKEGYDTDKRLKPTISNIRPDLIEGGVHDTPTHGRNVHAHGFDIPAADLTPSGTPHAKHTAAGFMPGGELENFSPKDILFESDSAKDIQDWQQQHEYQNGVEGADDYEVISANPQDAKDFDPDRAGPFKIVKAGAKPLSDFMPGEENAPSIKSKVSNQDDLGFYSRLAKHVDEAAFGRTKPKAAQHWLGVIDKWAKGADTPTLGQRAYGIAREEFGLSGIREWLKSRGSQPTTKQEVQDFIKQGGVQLKEVSKGGDAGDGFHIVEPDGTRHTFETDEERNAWIGDWAAEQAQETKDEYEITEKDGKFIVQNPMSDHEPETFDTRKQAEEHAYDMALSDALDASADMLHKYQGSSSGYTKFEGYQLPGGENYKEVLLTLPVKEEPTVVHDASTVWNIFDINGNNIGTSHGSSAHQALVDFNSYGDPVPGVQAVYQESGFNSGKKTRASEYKSPHWSESNVLAHIRQADHTDAEGNKVRLIEEIQSDWHQKGRKYGYRKPVDSEKSEELARKVEDAEKEMRKAHAEFDPVFDKIKVDYYKKFGGDWHNIGSNARQELIDAGDATPEGQRYNKAKEAYTQAKKEQDAVFEGGLDKVPDAPFKKTWMELAFKRALRSAIEDGADKIAWTPGQYQAERYNLSKQLNTVRVTRHNDGFYVDAFDKSDRRVITNKHAENPEALADLIGKELAQKVVDKAKSQPSKEEILSAYQKYTAAREKWNNESGAENEKAFKEARRAYNDLTAQETDAVEFSGLDLNVGGEGLKGFYDKMLPDFVRKYVGKWGGKVEKTKLANRGQDAVSGLDVMAKLGIPESQQNSYWRGLSDEERTQLIQDFREGTAGQVVHSVTITPEMREAIKGTGQPMFMPGGEEGKPLADFHADADKAGSIYQGMSDNGLHTFKELSTAGNFSIKGDPTPEKIQQEADRVRESFKGDTVTEDNLDEWLKANGFAKDEPSIKSKVAEDLSSFMPGEDKGTYPPTPDEEDRFGRGFYSALERAIKNKLPEKFRGDQAWGTIKNLPGIKADELEFTDVEKWLNNQKGTINKADLLDYVRANNVRVKTVGEEGADSQDDRWIVRGSDGDEIARYSSESEAERAARQFDDDDAEQYIKDYGYWIDTDQKEVFTVTDQNGEKKTFEDEDEANDYILRNEEEGNKLTFDAEMQDQWIVKDSDGEEIKRFDDESDADTYKDRRNNRLMEDHESSYYVSEDEDAGGNKYGPGGEHGDSYYTHGGEEYREIIHSAKGKPVIEKTHHVMHRRAVDPEIQAKYDRLNAEYKKINDEWHKLTRARMLDQTSPPQPPEERALQVRSSAVADEMGKITREHPEVEGARSIGNFRTVNEAEAYAQDVRNHSPNAEGETFVETKENKRPARGYTSSHWDESDPVAHTREQDFDGTDGQSVRLIDEVQSDWIQQARDNRNDAVKALMKEKGITKEEANKLVPKDYAYQPQAEFHFGNGALPAQGPFATREAAEKALAEYKQRPFFTSDPEKWTVERSPTDKRILRVVDPDGNVIHTSYSYKEGDADFDNAIIEAKADRDKANRAKVEERQSSTMPEPAFKTTWDEFAFKKSLYKAVIDKKDRIAWPMGIEHVKRYESGLRKAVDRIDWMKSEDGKNVTIVATKGDNTSFSETIPLNGTKTIQGKADVGLRDVVGKVMASKIHESDQDSGTFEGEDLSIGGDGMKGFYDEMMPKKVQKIVQKFGGKVKQTRIENKEEPEMRITEAGRKKMESAKEELTTIWNRAFPSITTPLDILDVPSILDRNYRMLLNGDFANDENPTALSIEDLGQAVAAARSMYKAHNEAARDKEPVPTDEAGMKVWSVDITPEMRAKIKQEGLPVYMPGGEEGKDLSTFDSIEGSKAAGDDLSKFTADDREHARATIKELLSETGEEDAKAPFVVSNTDGEIEEVFTSEEMAKQHMATDAMRGHWLWKSDVDSGESKLLGGVVERQPYGEYEPKAGDTYKGKPADAETKAEAGALPRKTPFGEEFKGQSGEVTFWGEPKGAVQGSAEQPPMPPSKRQRREATTSFLDKIEGEQDPYLDNLRSLKMSERGSRVKEDLSNFMPGNNKVGDVTPEERDKNFKAWAGEDSQIIANPLGEDIDPNKPLVVRVDHGSTHDFKTVDVERANVDNHFGKGFYGTDSEHDAGSNYAGEGPDLTARIEQRAEALDNEFSDASDEELMERFGLTKGQVKLIAKRHAYGSEGYTQKQQLLKEIARKDMHGGSPSTYRVWMKMEKPLVLEKDGGTRFDSLESYNEQEDTYDENPDSMPMKLYDAIQENGPEFHVDPQAVWNELTEAIGGDWDGVTAYDVDQAFRKSDALMDAYNDEGESTYNEFIKEVYRSMGFDGIVMDADNTFGNGRKSGKKMDMDYGTRHYIVFDPKQVKSATGNAGTFDPNNPNMTLMPGDNPRRTWFVRDGKRVYHKRRADGKFAPKQTLATVDLPALGSKREKKQLAEFAP